MEANAPANRGWIETIWSRFEPHYQLVKKTFFILVTVFNICWISLCISAFLFGTIYFHNMPTIQHTFPLHFHFNRTCMQQHKIVEHGLRWDRHLSSAYTKDCFPVAHVGLSYPTNSLLLQEGQSYTVLIKVEMPETPENLKMGMFMVNLVVHGASTNTLNDGEYRWSKRRKADETEIPLKLEASKPMIMRYKSPLLRYGFTVLFWPLLMLDIIHESQTLDEMLFEDLTLEQKSYNWTASVYLENPSIEMYSAHLDAVARFSGIQYLLYRWPVVSFLFGTLTFFIPTFFTCAVLFYFGIWKTFFATVEVAPNRNAQQRRRNQPRLEDPVVEDVPVAQEHADTENVPEHEPVILREPDPTTFTREPTIPDSTAHLSHPVAETLSSEESSQYSTNTAFSIPSTSQFNLPFSPPARRRSRSSSSSSSIEMISPPSTFSNLDDEELYTTSTQSAPSKNIDHPTEETTADDKSEELDEGLRRRFVEQD